MRSNEGGACGVLMLSNHAGLYQGDAALDPLYEALNCRHAVAFVHPAETSAGSPIAGIQTSQFEFGFDATRAVANLLINEVPQRFPAIRFVFTHSGSGVPSVAHNWSTANPWSPRTPPTSAERHTATVGQLLDQLSAAEDAARNRSPGCTSIPPCRRQHRCSMH